MSVNHARIFTCMVLFILLFSSTVRSADFSAPLIVLPLDQPLKGTGGYRISARVTDDAALEEVMLHYRTINSGEAFKTQAMVPERNDGFYSVVLPARQLQQPGIEYYIEARDHASNISQEPFPNQPRQVFYAASPASSDSGNTTPGGRKWLWIGLGVLAAGAVLAAGNGSNDKSDDGATLIIDASVP